MRVTYSHRNHLQHSAVRHPTDDQADVNRKLKNEVKTNQSNGINYLQNDVKNRRDVNLEWSQELPLTGSRLE